MAIHKRIQATISGATDVGIAQDNIIFAMLLFGFVVWITTKGELATYLAFFKPGSAGIPTNPVTASSTSGATGTTATPGNPVVGTVVGAGVIPGFPGTNLNNPFAGLPVVGPAFQSILRGNSQGSAIQTVPGQANPVPFFSNIGSWLKSITGIGQ